MYKAGDVASSEQLPFALGDYVFIPDARKIIEEGGTAFKAYAVNIEGGSVASFDLTVGDLTADERRILLAGCLINFYKE